MFTQGDQDLLSCLPRPLVMDRRWKPIVEISPNCPRCNSPNTKFCYYNNYSLTQPRYFCKGCRRYWTKGGSLRNVPIGGGCRKNRRGKSIRISSDRASNVNSIHRIAPPGIGSSGSDSSDCNVMGLAPNPSSSNTSSTIDLALVYAKFLNQHQSDSNPEFKMHELPREFDTPFDLSNISDPNVQFSLDQGIVGCNGTSNPSPEFQLSEGHQVLSEFASNYKQQERISDSTSLEMSTYGLQPVMTDELVVHEDMLWSNSPMVDSNFRWQATQLQGFETFPDDHLTLYSNPLEDNWSSFDLPCFEAFSRP